ncbi:hypothetical protein DUNSADRAFT_884 [Dunaliella salina]|uniref:Uncharacterized protein n=1 Tax=Dunaliella salina TaxID=3046 RepID=A0ABQ7H8P7_DUNSA|nr:hypothetical protein DUNSADRAFT_884 [Dunaliella salina]|eukprot:KAF5843208.1 hypothetical protein DUNSADRAFT_884 [Dunaliella salina]
MINLKKKISLLQHRGPQLQQRHNPPSEQLEDDSTESEELEGAAHKLWKEVAAWTAHEQRKQAVYNTVRGEGMQERKGGPGSGVEGSRGDAGLAPAVHQPRSHALLASMISAAKTGRRGSADGVQQRRRSSAGAAELGGGGMHWGAPQSEKKGPVRSNTSTQRLLAGGPASDPRLMGILTKYERPRPLSATAGSMPKRALSRPLSAAADGGAPRPRCQSASRVQPRHQSACQAEATAQHEAQMSAMQERLEDVRGQLEEALNTVQEQQRRLQQHTQLEPIFDRLAENFAFKSPEDVVARLEFLEDEKLGSLDELIRVRRMVLSSGQNNKDANAATTKAGQAEGEGLSMANPGDPLNILALVKEFLVAKSPQLASRQYLELQRVANHVWMQHFQHKEGLYGRVAETFEALSNLADIMAAKIKVIQDQLKNSVEGNKHLEVALARLTVQKRALQASLVRRDNLVRDMSDGLRPYRPVSAPVRRQPPAQQQGYPPLPPQLFQYPRASSIMSGYQGPPAPRIADRPAGAHWDLVAAPPKIPSAPSTAPPKIPSTSSRPSSARTGSLFNTPSATKPAQPQAPPTSEAPVCSIGSTAKGAAGIAQHPSSAASPPSPTASVHALHNSTFSPAFGAKHGSLSGGRGAAGDLCESPWGAPPSLPPHANLPHSSVSSLPAAANGLQEPHNLPSRGAHGGALSSAGSGGASSTVGPAQHQQQGYPAGLPRSDEHGNTQSSSSGAAIPEESYAAVVHVDAAARAASAAGTPLSQAAAAAELVMQQQRRERELSHELNQPRWQRRQQLLQQQQDGGQSAHKDQHLLCNGTQSQSHNADSDLLDRSALSTVAGSALFPTQESRRHAPKWVAPSRSAIEASFLTRLERAASMKG